VALAENIQLHELVLSNRLHIYIYIYIERERERDKTQKTPAEETTDKIGAILETSPWKQVVQIVQQMSMFTSSVHTAITLLYIHQTSVAHEPNNTDCKSPMTFMQ
jgi:hypothetical protein